MLLFRVLATSLIKIVLPYHFYLEMAKQENSKDIIVFYMVPFAYEIANFPTLHSVP